MSTKITKLFRCWLSHPLHVMTMFKCCNGPRGLLLATKAPSTPVDSRLLCWTRELAFPFTGADHWDVDEEHLGIKTPRPTRNIFPIGPTVKLTRNKTFSNMMKASLLFLLLYLYHKHVMENKSKQAKPMGQNFHRALSQQNNKEKEPVDNGIHRRTNTASTQQVRRSRKDENEAVYSKYSVDEIG